MILLEHPDLPPIARSGRKPAGGIRLADSSGQVSPAPAIVLDPSLTFRLLDPFADTSPQPVPTPVPLGYLSAWTPPSEFHRLTSVSGYRLISDPRTLGPGTYWFTLAEDEVYFVSRERPGSIGLEMIIKFPVPPFVDETYSFTLPASLSGATINSIEADGMLFTLQSGPSYTDPLQFKVAGDSFEIYQGTYRLAARADVFVSISHPLSLEPAAILQQYPLGTGLTPVQIDSFTYSFARTIDPFRPRIGDFLWDNTRRTAIAVLDMRWEHTLSGIEVERTPVFEIASEVTG